MEFYKDLDAEVSFSDGILTFENDQGTWVINKQRPNQQIWWSSPKSGPLRFYYDNGVWRNTRNPDTLLDMLLNLNIDSKLEIDHSFKYDVYDLYNNGNINLESLITSKKILVYLILTLKLLLYKALF